MWFTPNTHFPDLFQGMKIWLNGSILRVSTTINLFYMWCLGLWNVGMSTKTVVLFGGKPSR